jgi:hypothetical protein
MAFFLKTKVIIIFQPKQLQFALNLLIFFSVIFFSVKYFKIVTFVADSGLPFPTFEPRSPEMPVGGQVPLDRGRQVEVVAAGDGHVQDGDQVGDQQRMNLLGPIL